MSARPNAASRSLRVAEWPHADRLAWEIAQQPGDIFDHKAGVALRWRPATRHMIEDAYGHWLHFLAFRGELDLQADAERRPTHSRVSAYVTAMRAAGLAPYTVAGRISRLGNALEAVAPGSDFRVASPRGLANARQGGTRAGQTQANAAAGRDLPAGAGHDGGGRAGPFQDGRSTARLCIATGS